MRRPCVFSTSPTVTEEKALEIANNFEPDFAAKTRAQVLVHRYAPVRIVSHYALERPRWGRMGEAACIIARLTEMGKNRPFPASETNVWVSPKRTFTTGRANDRVSPEMVIGGVGLKTEFPRKFIAVFVQVQTQNVGRYGVRDDMKAASAIISFWLSLATTGCISATASPLRVPF